MPEQPPLQDPRFKGKRYEIQLAPEDPRRTQESAELCMEKVNEVKELMTNFENTHNLEELHAIKSFASKEERLASSRELAKYALKPIYERLQYLSSQEAVPNETHDNLQARYRLLNRAVGAITSDPTGVIFEIVDHNR